MGSKSSETTVGYRYYLGAHVILCQSPIDGISEIAFSDRPAWQGSIQDGQISINRPELFGGQSREGGVAGFVDVEGGASTQTANDYISTYLRPGQLIPAFRGVVGLVFRRFYWGNNPYIKPFRIRAHNVFNTYGQWLPGLAPVNGESSFSSTAVHLAFDVSASMATGTRLADAKTAANSLISSMSGYTGVSLRIQPFGLNSHTAFQATNMSASDITAAQAYVNALAAESPGGQTNYDDGLAGAESFFNAAETAIGADITSSEYVSAASGDSGGVGDTGASSAMRRVIVFLSDGAADPESSASDALTILNGLSGNVQLFAVGIGGGSGLAGDDLETIDNTPQDGVPIVDGSDANQLAGLISGAFQQSVDLNAAHIIRDVLISPTSDGSGSASDIGDSFATAAQTLFDEGFGLSFFWRRPSEKDEFVKLLEEHIGANVYHDPTTGKWEIKLIRPDYTVGSLFTFDNSTITEWIDYERPQQAELPNSITIVYTRRDTGEPASVTLHNVAAIQVTGRVINEKRTFEGITYPALANKVAQRELVAKTQPLAKGAIRVAYCPPTLTPGSAFIVDEPRMGINEMVVRVVEIEEPGIEDKDTSVIIRFVEDVFAADPADDAIGSDDAGTRDEESPNAQAGNVIFFEELSYYDQALRRGQSAIDDALTVDPGLGNWQMTTDRPNSQHIDASIYRYDYPNWIDAAVTPFMPVWVLNAALGKDAGSDTTFTADVTGREYELEAGQRIQIGSEIMRLDSVVISSGVATFTVGRGCLDTVPAEHVAYSYVMAWPGYVGSDAIDYTDGETVTTRITPRTSTEVYPLGSAVSQNLTFDERAFRPYPVGQLQLDGAYTPSGDQSGTVLLSWAHRNRLTQTTTSINDHGDGDIGPESGVEYILVKRLIDSVSGVESVSHTEEIPLSPPQVTSVYVDLDDSSFAAYATANTVAMELGIKTQRESPPYENWQTPFIRFTTSFAGGAVPSSPSVEPITGFSARKATASGSSTDVISGWDTPDWNPDSDFNDSTGIWTAPRTGVVWMGAMGFPTGGTAGGTEFNVDTQRDGADFNMAGRDYAGTGDAHGSSNFHAAILQVAASEAFQIRQNGDTAENCAFSAIYLDTSVAFSAYRTATLGTINTTITGYTEDFDLGSDFNATTGVFTVPTTGKYLVTFHGKATAASGNSASGFNVVVNAGTDYSYTYGMSGGGLWSNSLGHSFILDLTATDTVSITQVNELLETVRFSMALVTPTVAFAARDTAEGGAGDTMATWTEDFDLGSDFNATSGVFTAPEDGQYIVMGSGNRTNSAGEWNLSLLLNGSEYLKTRHYVTGVTAHACPARFGIVMNLAASDTLAMRQNTGSTGERRFAVMKV